MAAMAWNSRLRRPLRLTDGRTLKTLDDARAFIGSLPEREQQYDRWISLSALLLSAAQSDNPAMVAIVTNKLSDALPLASLRLLVWMRPKNVRQHHQHQACGVAARHQAASGWPSNMSCRMLRC
jgi:hypothetical protein